METLFRTQPSVKISELFRENIAASNQVLIASAYLTADGLRRLGIPNGDRATKIICGVHGCVSDSAIFQLSHSNSRKFSETSDKNLKFQAKNVKIKLREACDKGIIADLFLKYFSRSSKVNGSLARKSVALLIGNVNVEKL